MAWKRKFHSTLGTHHYGSQTPEYRAWVGMKQRCLNPNYPKFADYGGRGITVAIEWARPDGFPAFLAHVGPRPYSPYLRSDFSLDRIDNDGHYVPGNVRWATQLEQVHNQRQRRRHDRAA